MAADTTGDALRSSLLRYGDLVRNVGALFEQHLVNHEQFKQYLQDNGYFENQFPGLLGIGLVQLVWQPQLAAFVASVRADGIPNFAVSPAGTRGNYCLGSYAETLGLHSSIPILGFDLCTVSVVDIALQQATATGSQTVIPGRALSSLYAGDFVLVSPIYLGSDPGSLSARQQAVMGWSIGIIDSPVMRQAVLGSDGSGIQFSLSAGATPLPYNQMMTSVGLRRAPVWDITEHFVAHGQWTLQFSPKPGAFVASATGPMLLLVVGLVASTLLALVIWLLAFGRARALKLVRQRTGQLEHLALHDALTGLPNRALIMDRARQMLMRAERQNLQVGALFLDLDNFKDVNDSLGHDTGDVLLCAVAERLTSSVRGAETVGRLGGDEFVILVEDDYPGIGPDLVGERLVAVMAEPFHLKDRDRTPLAIRASIGVAVGPRTSAEELLRDADVALYEAKNQGKNRAVVFRSEMQDAANDRRILETDLRGALGKGELFVMYQPTFDLSDRSVGGVEALLRWRHPVRGLIPPDTFIPIAEETGLISSIGQFVLEQACLQTASWHAAGLPIAVAVNVSGRQLERRDFAGEVRRALTMSQLPPEYLTLEITETVMMRDVDATVDQMVALKELGVRLAIDDFGTGYSSLAYLRKFPVDSLKIDRSFITNIAESEESGALIHTLVQLGKTLHLETLAEGIEEDYQLDMLKSQDCDSGQGFIFSRPLDALAAQEFFRRHQIKDRTDSLHDEKAAASA